MAEARKQGRSKQVCFKASCSVQYAYELASTRRAFEEASTNYSLHQDQARGAAINPPDPH
eukprot:1161001-Pelagomonas_calceolata.AAC.3